MDLYQEIYYDMMKKSNSSPARHGSLRPSSVITNTIQLPLISDFSFQIKLYLFMAIFST